jgi:hypothetical protein
MLEITKYKTGFGYIVKMINCVEEGRLASMKYNGRLDSWRDQICGDVYMK